MIVAPDRIYLRVTPSGAVMTVAHPKPAEGSQKSVEYVRADLLDVKTLLEINKKRKVSEWIGNRKISELGVNPIYDAAFEDGHGGG